jgi:poly(3-hydroxybutyrate) depolymerase
MLSLFTLPTPALSATAPLPSALLPLSVGTPQLRHVRGEPGTSYVLYVPPDVDPGRGLFVSVHGISRNRGEHVGSFVRHAARERIVMVAPLFAPERFHGYQRLAVQARGIRPDHALNRILEEVGALTGADIDRLFLFGHSGGGQFVHRYAMAYPRRTQGIVVGAAGWYTFPDLNREFPLGIAPNRELADLRFEPEAFLRIPICVFVGGRDTDRDEALNQHPDIDAQQGRNRVERARRWVHAMQEAARAQGLDTPYRFELLPRSGHSFSSAVRRDALDRRVFDCLFPVPAPGATT